MKRRMPVTILKTTYTAIAAARMTMSDSKRISPFNVTVYTGGNIRAWEQECSAFVASTRAICPRSQEKCEHLPFDQSLQSEQEV